jgi:hypothetical protein
MNAFKDLTLPPECRTAQAWDVSSWPESAAATFAKDVR